jgi:hypothetical protein
MTYTAYLIRDNGWSCGAVIETFDSFTDAIQFAEQHMHQFIGELDSTVYIELDDAPAAFTYWMYISPDPEPVYSYDYREF